MAKDGFWSVIREIDEQFKMILRWMEAINMYSDGN